CEPPRPGPPRRPRARPRRLVSRLCARGGVAPRTARLGAELRRRQRRDPRGRGSRRHLGLRRVVSRGTSPRAGEERRARGPRRLGRRTRSSRARRRLRGTLSGGGTEAMPDKTFKLIEIVGVSEESIQQAVRNALTK